MIAIADTVRTDSWTRTLRARMDTLRNGSIRFFSSMSHAEVLRAYHHYRTACLSSHGVELDVWDGALRDHITAVSITHPAVRGLRFTTSGWLPDGACPDARFWYAQNLVVHARVVADTILKHDDDFYTRSDVATALASAAYAAVPAAVQNVVIHRRPPHEADHGDIVAAAGTFMRRFGAHWTPRRVAAAVLDFIGAQNPDDHMRLILDTVDQIVAVAKLNRVGVLRVAVDVSERRILLSVNNFRS